MKSKKLILGLFLAIGTICILAPQISSKEPCYYVTDEQGPGWAHGPLTGGNCYTIIDGILVLEGPVTACYPAPLSPGCVACGCRTWLQHCVESTNPPPEK